MADSPKTRGARGLLQRSSRPRNRICHGEGAGVGVHRQFESSAKPCRIRDWDPHESIEHIVAEWVIARNIPFPFRHSSPSKVGLHVAYVVPYRRSSPPRFGMQALESVLPFCQSSNIWYHRSCLYLDVRIGDALAE